MAGSTSRCRRGTTCSPSHYRSDDAMMTRILSAAMLLSAMTSLPASAQQYTARRNGDVVQLEDTKSQMVVSILPSSGNITSEFKVKGQNVLRWPYASMEDYKARRGLNGIPFL